MSDLVSLIQKAAGSFMTDKVYFFDAEVLSVDNDTRTCDVVTIGGKSSNELTVRLMATVDDGEYKIPKVGSTVVVFGSDRVDPVIIMYSEIESITWLGGEYGGVPIVTHPTNVNKGLLKKINNLEHIVNDLISKYNVHTHAGVTAGASVTAVPSVLETNILTDTVASDIEHPKIEH